MRRGVVPFAWVNADEHYGMNPDFLDGIAGLDKWYFAEVPKTTMVWPEEVKILPADLGQSHRNHPSSYFDERAEGLSDSILLVVLGIFVKKRISE